MALKDQTKELILSALGTPEAQKDLVEAVDSSVDKTEFDSITPIADPSGVDAEECATKINEILAALKS